MGYVELIRTPGEANTSLYSFHFVARPISDELLHEDRNNMTIQGSSFMAGYYVNRPHIENKSGKIYIRGMMPLDNAYFAADNFNEDTYFNLLSGLNEMNTTSRSTVIGRTRMPDSSIEMMKSNFKRSITEFDELPWPNGILQTMINRKDITIDDILS